MTQSLYLGIDIAKETFEAATDDGLQQTRLGQFPNTAQGFQQLQARLSGLVGPQTQVVLILEPTGGYELAMVAYAHEQGWQVCLPNPRLLRDWAKGDGRRAKTDRVDGQMLAHYGAQKHPSPQAPLPGNIAQLSELLARQQDLEQLLHAERNRLGAYQARPHPHPVVIASLERTIPALEQELAQIEQAIKQLIKGDPQLKTALERLRTVPGIGPKNALAVLVILTRWQVRAGEQADSKGLVAFVGLDPLPYESGQSVHRRWSISKRGDNYVRQALYMGAMGGLKRKGPNPLRDFYQRLVGRGKLKKLALVAAARKILVWAWCVFSRQVDFDPGSLSPTEPVAA